MKRIYESPQMEVIKVQMQQTLLTGSTTQVEVLKDSPVDWGAAEGRGYDFDDDDDF